MCSGSCYRLRSLRKRSGCHLCACPLTRSRCSSAPSELAAVVGWSATSHMVRRRHTHNYTTTSQSHATLPSSCSSVRFLLSSAHMLCVSRVCLLLAIATLLALLPACPCSLLGLLMFRCLGSCCGSHCRRCAIRPHSPLRMKRQALSSFGRVLHLIDIHLCMLAGPDPHCVAE